MFTTERKTDYIRHMKTKKHIDNCSTKRNPKDFYCVCGKKYKHRSGLSRHRPVCPIYLEVCLNNDDGDYVDTDDVDVNSIVSENIDQSSEQSVEQDQPQTQVCDITNTSCIDTTSLSELQGNDIKSLLTDIAQQLREMKETQLVQQQQITNNNNSYVFNLNMFLNENCKDALSLQDFIKQISFVFDDLKDKSWRSKVLLNNLGSLQLENRPFHCLDTTTCQVVMKNGEQWQEGSKADIVSTLDRCGKQVQTQFGPKWDLQYPNWTTSDRHSKQYLDLWLNLTREQTPSQVEEDLKQVSSNTILTRDNAISPKITKN